jgi:hypothetical protein
VDAAFSELEEAFFREGDEMSAAADSAVMAEVIDLSSRAIVDADYYDSIAVTIEADEVSGGFEAAA